MLSIYIWKYSIVLSNHKAIEPFQNHFQNDVELFYKISMLLIPTVLTIHHATHSSYTILVTTYVVMSPETRKRLFSHNHNERKTLNLITYNIPFQFQIIMFGSCKATIVW
jgi:hypothetical protein